MSTLSARWVAYEPRGARIGELPEPLGYEATVNRWDPGSFRLTYSSLAAAGEVLGRPLTQGLEVALEVSDGGDWTEPSSARFLLLDRDDDFLDDQAVKVLSGPSYDWQASKIKDLNRGALEDEDAEVNAGMRVWAAATPGHIVKTLLDEAAARGSAPFTFTFTATHDSAGEPWEQEVTWAEAHGQTLDVYLQKLTAQNRAEYDTAGRELRLFNVGGLTQNHTYTAIYDAETHVTAAPSSESISELAHRFTMTAGDGVNHEFLATSTPAPWGRWDWYDSDRDTTNEGTIQALLQAEAERSARVRGQYIRDLANPADVPLEARGWSRVWRQPTPPPAGTIYRWTGTPHESTSEKVVDGQVVAVNEALDPHFDIPGNVASWWSPTSSNQWQPQGMLLSAAAYTHNLGANPGETWAARVRLRAVDGSPSTVRLGINETGSTGSFLGSAAYVTYPLPASGAIEAVTTHTLSPEAFGLRVRLPDTPVLVESILLVQLDSPSAAVPDFFDGDTPDDRAHDLWIDADGTPHTWDSGTNQWVEYGETGHEWPLVHYGTGSWVTAPTHVRGEQTRVQQIILRDNGEAPPTVALTLNDRWLDADERRRRRQAGIRGGGAAEGGGSEVTPPPPRPPDVDPRKPGKVEGLVGSSEAFLNPQGYARSTISLEWAAVGVTDPPSGPFTPDRYEVQSRQVLSPPRDWHMRNPVFARAVDYSPFNPGVQYQFRVRARAASSAAPPGDWSDTLTITTATYDIPPPVPSTPILSVTLGVIKALWDGEDEDGQPMPLGFRRVEVAVTTTPVSVPGTADVIDTISAKGGAYIVTGGSTDTRYVWFRAVGAGGRSDWSERAQIDPRGDNVIDERVDDLIDNVIPGLEGQITLAGGKFTGADRAPTASDGVGKPDGAIWNHYDGNRLVQSYIWEPNPLAPGLRRWGEREPALVHIDGGTFGDLDGIRLRARTVLADRLAITPSNIFPDPYFVDGPGWTAAGFSVVEDESMPGGTALQITTAASQRVRYYHGPPHRPLRLEAGATYRLRWTANLTGDAGSPNMSIYVQYRSADGTNRSLTTSNVSLEPARDDYVTLSVDLTILDNVGPGELVGIAIATRPPYAAGHTIRIGGMDMARKVGNILLEDGAVTADKMNAAEIWANEAFIGHARAQVLTVGSVNPKHLNFGTDELLPNPMWMDEDYRALYPQTSPFSYSTNATYRVKGQTHTLMVSGSAASNFDQTPLSDRIAVSPGDKFYIEINGRRGSGTDFNVAIRLRWTLANQTTVNSDPIALTPALPSSRNVMASGVVEAPDGAESARAWLVVMDGPTTQNWYVTECSVRRAMASSDDAGEGMEITPRGIRAWNEDGEPTIDIGNGTANLIVGRRFQTDISGAGRPMLALSNSIVDTGAPGIRFSTDGDTGGSAATIHLRIPEDAPDSRGILTLRSGQADGDGRRHNIRLQEGAEVHGEFRGGTGSHLDPTWTWRINASGHADFHIGSATRRLFNFPANGWRFVMGDNDNSEIGGNQDGEGLPYLVSLPTYRRTSTVAPNVVVVSSGRLVRSTSLTAFKVDIDDAAEQTAAVKQLRPVTYRDRGQVERGEHAPVLLGLLAEEVEALGIPGLTSDDLDGNLNGVQYERLAVALLPWLHDIESRLTALEGAST